MQQSLGLFKDGLGFRGLGFRVYRVCLGVVVIWGLGFILFIEASQLRVDGPQDAKLRPKH